MPEHPLVTRIRFCLAIIALMAVAAFWPEGSMFVLASGFGWWKGCACCAAGCTIFSDDYSTDRTGSDYTTVAGSWSVGSGKLTCTTASAAIIENTASSAGATGLYATADITPATNSDPGRLIVAYTDSSNYWFAEIQSGAVDGTLKLYERSGGANTQRGATETLTGYTTGLKSVCICITPTHVYAAVGAVRIIYAAVVSVASKKAGLGTGAGSTAVDFDNFYFKKHKVDDSTCMTCCEGTSGCSCDSGTAPYEVQVIVSGYADNTCTDCANLNATFVCATVSSGSLSCVTTFGSAGCSIGCCWLSSTITLCTVNYQVGICVNSSQKWSFNAFAGVNGETAVNTTTHGDCSANDSSATTASQSGTQCTITGVAVSVFPL